MYLYYIIKSQNLGSDFPAVKGNKPANQVHSRSCRYAALLLCNCVIVAANAVFVRKRELDIYLQLVIHIPLERAVLS